jgi:hypothetical protein
MNILGLCALGLPEDIVNNVEIIFFFVPDVYNKILIQTTNESACTAVAAHGNFKNSQRLNYCRRY